MAKGSGGGGRPRGRNSVIGAAPPVEVTSEYRGPRGAFKPGYFSHTVTEAVEVKGEPGVLELRYPDWVNREQVSRRTTRYTYRINAGIYQVRSHVEEHNINWGNVRVIRGETYPWRKLLRDKGFRWNREKRQWEKP